MTERVMSSTAKPTDIVQRLLDPGWLRDITLLQDAAEEIARLRAALQRIKDLCPPTAQVTLVHEMADTAAAALEPKPWPLKP